MLLLFWLCAFRALGQAAPPPLEPGTFDTPLHSWSFRDSTNWTSDLGSVPLSFTNLGFSQLGNGWSLVVDSAEPAWLRYRAAETNGATNLTVSAGSLIFWFAPGWSSVSAGGTGPGVWSRLIEVGAYTTNSSFGWWSLYLDPEGANLFFSTQTNHLSGDVQTRVSAPVAWTTNDWHFIALTYSATNTALYLDGALVTNGLGVTVYPGPDVLTNGFTLGGDAAGLAQSHGMFNNLLTYDTPLNAGTLGTMYDSDYAWYLINPLNFPYMSEFFVPAAASSTNRTVSDLITGAGALRWVGTNSGCATNAAVWMTDFTVTLTGSNRVTFVFSIGGGAPSAPYDVFASSAFGPAGQTTWERMGEGYTCNRYALTNLPARSVFFILGTPLDSDGDGFTDAYERLSAKTDPYIPTFFDSDGDGLPDGWEILNGFNPSSPDSLDSDFDNISLYDEYRGGTDPNATDALTIFVATPRSTGLVP